MNPNQLTERSIHIDDVISSIRLSNSNKDSLRETSCRKSLFPTNVTCCYCTEIVSKATIHQHMEKHVPLCEVSQTARLNKLLQVSSSQRKVYNCSICDCETSNLSYHNQQEHSDLNGKAKTEANEKSKLTLKYVPKTQPVIYICPIANCKAMCKSRKLFRQHLNRVHTAKSTITKDEENEMCLNYSSYALNKDIFKLRLKIKQQQEQQNQDNPRQLPPQQQSQPQLQQQVQLQPLQQLQQLAQQQLQHQQLQPQLQQQSHLQLQVQQLQLQQLLQQQVHQHQSQPQLQQLQLQPLQLQQSQAQLQQVLQPKPIQQQVQQQQQAQPSLLVQQVEQQNPLKELRNQTLLNEARDECCVDSDADDDGTDDEIAGTDDEIADNESDSDSSEDKENDPDYVPSPTKVRGYYDFRGQAKQFLEEYETHLGSDYCAKVQTKKEFTAVVRILRCCNCNVTINGIFDKNHFDRGFLEIFREKDQGDKKKESSMLTYSIYLHNMCQFIHAFKLYTKYNVKMSTVVGFQCRLKMLRTKFRKGNKLDNVLKEKFESDWIRKYLTPDYVRMFRQSEYHKDAVRLFAEFGADPNKPLLRREYSLMRDLLIHYCLFVSASRDGVLIELMLSEFEARELVNVENKKYWIVEVYRHKTVLTSGAACLTLDSDAVEWIKIFIKNVRPKVLLPRERNSSGEPHILLPWTRKCPPNNENVRLSSGSISKRLRLMFVNAGVLPKTVGHFSCNILRKATSTAIHESHPDEDEKVCGSMSHAKRTAEQCYRRHDKIKNNAFAQQLVHNYWSSSTATIGTTESSTATSANCPGTTANTSGTQAMLEDGYCILDADDVSMVVENLGSSPTLSEVKEKFDNVASQLKSPRKAALTPEKLYRKLKRNHESNTSPCLSKVLPKKFWPRRFKKYKLEELEAIYTLCWSTGCKSLPSIRGVVQGTSIEKYSDLEIYSVLQAWRKK